MTRALAWFCHPLQATWVVGSILAFAWAGAAHADERSEIAAARVAAEATYAERIKGCRDRFAVTACVDAAKRDRREALDALRISQLALDEQRRRERAQVRRKEIADKLEEDARRDRERVGSTPPRSAASASGGAGVRPMPSASVEPPSPEAAASANADRKQRRPPAPSAPRRMGARSEPTAERATREAASRKAYADKQRERESHREQSLDATLRRLSSKPPSSSLPVPGSVAAARPPASAASR